MFSTPNLKCMYIKGRYHIFMSHPTMSVQLKEHVPSHSTCNRASRRLPRCRGCEDVIRGDPVWCGRSDCDVVHCDDCSLSMFVACTNCGANFCDLEDMETCKTCQETSNSSEWCDACSHMLITCQICQNRVCPTCIEATKEMAKKYDVQVDSICQLLCPGCAEQKFSCERDEDSDMTEKMSPRQINE